MDMADDQPERGPYERLIEMNADITWLEAQAQRGRLPENTKPWIARLRENIDILLGEGDSWGEKAKIIEDVLVTDPLSKRESP